MVDAPERPKATGGRAILEGQQTRVTDLPTRAVAARVAWKSSCGDATAGVAVPVRARTAAPTVSRVKVRITIPP